MSAPDRNQADPRWILPLAQIEPNDRPSVGNKAWYLSRLIQAGLEVPTGLAIGREAGLLAMAADAQQSAPLIEFWQRLEIEVGRTFRLEDGVAVRSSSPNEDTMGRSMAGQFVTVLHVKNQMALRQALKECWKSAETGGATGGIGVVIQAMIEADVAGVAFSRNPVLAAAEGERVTIELTLGTAEHLVSGEVVPCRASVAGDDIRILPGSAALPNEYRAVLLEVAQAARRVEQVFGFPVDMEWAARGGRAFFVQARPITTGKSAAKPLEVPAGSWTRHIAEDLWADPLTSFEEAMLTSLAPRFDLRGPARWLGIDVPDDTRILAGIGSYLYVNCTMLEEVAKVLPRALRIDPIVALFPPGANPRELPSPTIARVARALLGAAAFGLLDTNGNPILATLLGRGRFYNLEHEGQSLDAVDVTQLSDQLLAQHLTRCFAFIGKILDANQFIYLWAFVFSWAVEWSGRAAGLSREAWLSHLGGTGHNATERMEELLEEVGEAIRISGVQVAGRTFDSVVTELASRGFSRAADAARTLLFEFGVRASQRSLIEPRWAEAPLTILERARRFARKRQRQHATGKPIKLPIMTRLALALANHQLDLREDQRFLIDTALFAIRRAVLDAGRRYGLNGDSFFLLPDEVSALLAGRLGADVARERAKERHDRYRTAGAPPAFWVDGQPVRGTAAQLSGNRVSGVGASPGMASGRVRIVERFDELSSIDRGDLVVAPLMGPAWAPLLQLAGGVVTEKGGLLDHFAILAREAAVPAVTGAEGAIARLRGVERATVDGTRGLVSW